MKYPIETWKWKGLPGHFNYVHSCIFRLHTQVGPYKISTVGCMYLEGKTYKSFKKMEEIGFNRHYETYVFCGDNYNEIDAEGLNAKDFETSDELDNAAEKMHFDMCLKYAK